MKKIAIFLTLTATAILLGGCYFPPPPHRPAVVRPGAARAYRHPVMVPAPRVIVPLPPPVYYYR
ncbi:hypothetical protein VU10_02145 [Desulfobulbus sp. US1]|nr:hypothetical protein [Desulfobulbus sp. US4]MCW5209003.1 hypothetical protein [Desulfobulbus sp. US1]WLE97424.1 MAG: hypothetical protein QTN59_01035 [Candidatus Electrothrix communis]